ncbi:phage lysis protein [Enterobacter hormaechei]
MPGSAPATNGDLSGDIRRLEHALAACALQIETVKACQDKLDEEINQPAKSAN